MGDGWRSRVLHSIYEPLQPKGKSPSRLELHRNCFFFLFTLHMKVTLKSFSPRIWLKCLNPFDPSLKQEFKEINLCSFRLGFQQQFIFFHPSSKWIYTHAGSWVMGGGEVHWVCVDWKLFMNQKLLKFCIQFSIYIKL